MPPFHHAEAPSLLDFVPELFRAAFAIAAASFGLLTLLVYLRDRSRKELGLYALTAFLIAGYGVEPVLARMGLVPPAIAFRVFPAFAFGSTLTVYLFLLRFLELRSRRRALWATLPATGVVLSLAVERPDVGVMRALIAASIAATVGEILVSLCAKKRRRRPDTAPVFAGLALFLLAALFDFGVEANVLPSIRSGTGVEISLVGPAFVVFTALLVVVLADEGRRLLVRATVDPLTNLLNRGTFLAKAAREVARAERTGHAVAVAMLDLDHFKSVNDRFGHPAGDRVLVAVARAVAETIRGIDLAGRYGGEELIVLLIEADEAAAVRAVERIRAAVAALAPPAVPAPVTLSAGIAVHHGLFERTRLADLVHRADAALYESKRAGRNRATLERPDSGPPDSPADVRYR